MRSERIEDEKECMYVCMYVNLFVVYTSCCQVSLNVCVCVCVWHVNISRIISRM